MHLKQFLEASFNFYKNTQYLRTSYTVRMNGVDKKKFQFSTKSNLKYVCHKAEASLFVILYNIFIKQSCL